MKRWMKWALPLLIVALVAAGVVRALSARASQKEALAASTAATDAGFVELAATDVTRVQTRDLVQGLAVSGTLKAVNSAFVKARVSGELQGLTVREGDNVKAGQVIARIEAGEYQARLRQAQEQARSAKAQVDLAQRQHDNNKALVDQGFISKTALDTSLNNLNAAIASYHAAQAGTDVTARSVDDTVLKAPITGQVSQRLAQPGERVGIDAKIIEIVDLSKLELEATLGAAESLDVRVGQPALLQIEGSQRPIQAKVVRINPSAQAASRSVLAYLSIDNNGGDAPLLRQGLFAQGTLGTAQAPVLSLAVGALRTDKPAPYVQAIENGAVVHRPVTPGARGHAGADEMIAVQGLPDGLVVINGNIGTLREGTKVRFTPMPAIAPAANAAAGAAPGARPAP